MAMNGIIQVNGAEEALAAQTVAELLTQKGVGERRGIAVALNGHVVLRKEWRETRLKAGDSIEIVQARQGG